MSKSPTLKIETPAGAIVSGPDVDTLIEALKLLRAAVIEYRLLDVRKRYSLCVADAAAGSALAKVQP
jgi:hypothetical protein